jgi:hypothetical protein
LVLILAVAEGSNALKHNHIARRHSAFVVTHQRRNMRRNRECGSTSKLASEHVKVPGGAQIAQEVTNGGWVNDDEWSALGAKECAGDGNNCRGWRIGTSGSNKKVGARKACRRLIERCGVGMLGDADCFGS